MNNFFSRCLGIAIGLGACGVAASVASAATLYVAVDGAGDGKSPDKPLPDVAAAYKIAAPGDTIEMAAGEYGAQPPIPNRKNLKDDWESNIIVRPAPGAKVSFSGSNQWTIYGGHLTLSGLHFSMRLAVRRGANYFRMENCVSKLLPAPGQEYAGVSSLTFGGEHAQIVDNLFDGSAGQSDGIVIASGNKTILARDVLIENNVIHNYLYAPGGVHEDGIQLYDCADIIIRRNKIANVGNSCIILSPGAGKHINNVRIENNFLQKVNTNSSISLDCRMDWAIGIVVLNNTILGSVYALPGEGRILRNNIISHLSNKGAPEDHNYITSWNKSIGVKPDATSQTGPLPAFVNVEENDLHIAPDNTVNLKFGAPADAPENEVAQDIDGQKRGETMFVGADDPSLPAPVALKTIP